MLTGLYGAARNRVERKDLHSGELSVEVEEDKITYLLNLNEDPEILKDKDFVCFKVVSQDNHSL